MEFADILEEKLARLSQLHGPQAPTPPHRASQSWQPSPVLGLKIFTFNRLVKRPYPVRSPRRPSGAPPPPAQAKPTPPPASEPVLCASELPQPLPMLLEQMRRLGAELDPQAFTRSGLKREYRRLLKRMHPDQNKGSHQARTNLESLLVTYRQLVAGLKASKPTG